MRLRSFAILVAALGSLHSTTANAAAIQYKHIAGKWCVEDGGYYVFSPKKLNVFRRSDGAKFAFSDYRFLLCRS